MEEILELVGNLDIRIKELLKGLGVDETSFLKKYADSQPIQIAFAMGSRSMATKFAQTLLEHLPEVEEE